MSVEHELAWMILCCDMCRETIYIALHIHNVGATCGEPHFVAHFDRYFVPKVLGRIAEKFYHNGHKGINRG